MKPGLVLASGSPRRKQLLEQLGLEFDIQPPEVDESVLLEEAPRVYVKRLAENKAAVVLARNVPGTVILAADTTVVLSGNILGKPESKEHGVQMLRELSGASHEVLTGVSICTEARCETFCVSTIVRFRSLQTEEIEWYWGTGEPHDKAGAYGLQGAGSAFVESLAGSYSNVVGLPLSETVAVLRDFSVSCLGYPAGQHSEVRNDFSLGSGSRDG